MRNQSGPAELLIGGRGRARVVAVAIARNIQQVRFGSWWETEEPG